MIRKDVNPFEGFLGIAEDISRGMTREKVEQFTDLLRNIEGRSIGEIKDEDFLNLLQILICTDQEIVHYENTREKRALGSWESSYLLEAVFFNSILSQMLMNAIDSSSFGIGDIGKKPPILMGNHNIEGMINFNWDRAKSNRIFISFDDPKGHKKLMRRMTVTD